jgi:hypothetical protein
MSSTVTMPRIRPRAVHDGHGHQVVLGEDRADLLLVHVLGHRDQVGVHHVAHEARGLGLEQVAERDHAQQSLLLVEHVGVIDGLQVLVGLTAQVEDRLFDRHVWPHAREARAHQTAGVVLLVREQRAHLAPRRFLEQGDQGLALLRLCLLQEVGGVVGSERTHPQALLGVRKRADELHLIVARQAGEEVLRFVRPEQAEPVRALFLIQHAPGLAQLVALQARIRPRGREERIHERTSPRCGPTRPAAKARRRSAQCGLGCMLVLLRRARGERSREPPQQDRSGSRSCIGPCRRAEGEETSPLAGR